MVTRGLTCRVRLRVLKLKKTAAAHKVIASLSQSEREVALRDLDTEDWWVAELG